MDIKVFLAKTIVEGKEKPKLILNIIPDKLDMNRDPINSFFDDPSIPKLSVEEEPETQSWAFEPLYSEDKKGELRLWQVGFDGRYNKIYTRYGHVKTGNFITSNSDVIINKSNRNIEEQSMLQIRKLYNDKYIQDNYRPAGMDASHETNVALAKEYESGRIDVWPVAVQPKLDGQRLQAYEENTKVVFKSRQGRVQAQFEFMTPEISLYLSFLPRGSILDGEVYSHGKIHQDIMSIITKRKGGYHKDIESIKYFIYDIYYPENPPYEYRYNKLLDAYKLFIDAGNINNNFFILVATPVYEEKFFRSYHDYFVNQGGYEGMIIRRLGGPHPTQKQKENSNYSPKRSYNIMKYKDFKDQEGIIIDVTEGKGKFKGKAIFIIQALSNGKTFKLVAAGNMEEKAKLFQNKGKVLGRIYKYSFANLTKAGIPRFPVGIGFRDYLE